VAEVRTDASGAHSFTDLVAGTYTIVEGTIPFASSYDDGPDFVGTVNGQAQGEMNANDQFTVTLEAGQNGIDYNFTELLAG
jgi:hypothetical protein